MKLTADELGQAIRGLDDESRQALITELAQYPEFVEDLLDALELLRSRAEPTRPYDEFADELDRE